MVTGEMLKVLEGFHHQLDRWIAGKMACSKVDRYREWPPVEDTLDITGVWPIKEYIKRRQATITAHIACQPIYELCTGVDNITGSDKFMRWWDQDVGREVE